MLVGSAMMDFAMSCTDAGKSDDALNPLDAMGPIVEVLRDAASDRKHLSGRLPATPAVLTGLGNRL